MTERMEPAQAFKRTISQFAFSLPSTSAVTSEPQIARGAVSVKDEVETLSLSSLKDRPVRPATRSSVRTGIKNELEDGSPKKKRRVLKRGYADPETYAHLSLVPDHLAPSLDVMFCGINPGCMSATKGHHFANPTNHFWKALHLSGFTSRLLSPSEGSTLPILYSLGLTNLVSRPSAEQAELSKEEMKQSVPSLKAKIANHRPRVVCFVGKGIWVIVEAVFRKQVQDIFHPLAEQEDTAKNKSAESPLVSPSTRSKLSRPTNRLMATSKSFDWGLQEYKLVYTGLESSSIKEEQFAQIEPPMDKSTLKMSGFLVTETLFFVMPNTSGRVVSHQLADKVKLFTRLRDDLERIKSNALDTSGMKVVPLS